MEDRLEALADGVIEALDDALIQRLTIDEKEAIRASLVKFAQGVMSKTVRQVEKCIKYGFYA